MLVYFETNCTSPHILQKLEKDFEELARLKQSTYNVFSSHFKHA